MTDPDNAMNYEENYHCLPDSELSKDRASRDSVHAAVRLLPCPFCGEATLESALTGIATLSGGRKVAVFCHSCFSEGPTAELIEDAKAKWNDRTPHIWMPISTAPKDGTRIIGFADGEYATVQFSFGYWNLCVAGTLATDSEWWPTHWMPLPVMPNVPHQARRAAGEELAG